MTLPIPRLPWSMLRRAALAVLALCLLLAGGIGALLASRDLDSIARDVVNGLQVETGGQLAVERTRVRYWPTPRIVLEGVQFRRADGGATATASRAVISVSLFDLIDGALDSPNITLDGATIRLNTGPVERLYSNPRALTGVADAISSAFDQQKRLANLRLVISRGRFVLDRGVQGGEMILDPVDFRLKYAARAGQIDLFARRISEIRPVELTLSLPTRLSLEARERAPAQLQLSGFGSRLNFAGTVSRRPDLALSGRLEASIQDALERALGFAGGERRGRGDEITSVSANVTFDPRGGGLDNLVIQRGDGRLSGIASFRETAGRWSLASTLAGDLIDGTTAHAAMERLKTGEGNWSPRELDVNPAPGLDLDLRISTRLFRLGPVVLENAALSVFTRAGRAEFAIADSRHGDGMFKARLSVLDRAGAQDIRLTTSGERLESETFLDRALGLGRVRGPANFAFALESHGQSIAQLIANLSGSGTLDIRNGEISGIDLNRLATRSAEMRAEAALITSLGGRSPFDALTLNLAFRDGRVEPVGSSFATSRVEGSLEGFIDLAKQQNLLNGYLKRRQPVPGQRDEFFAFRIEGPLFQPMLKPDPSLLLRRS